MRRGGRGWGGFPSRAKLAPPEHGIKVKKAGTTWWGQRWIEALERISWGYSNRLPRGRTYARAGRVHDLSVNGGEVTARVTGTRSTPYKVTLAIAPLSREHWDRAIVEMAAQALFTTQLLSGEMPLEIDQLFRSLDVSLFPGQASDLRTSCSCPDWANPCKHVAATHFVLGEAFDRDPFLLFELRGRTKEQVLAALDRARSGARGGRPSRETVGAVVEAATVSLEEVSPADFDRMRGPTEGLGFRIEPPPQNAGILRQIGAPPGWSLEASPFDLLAPLYRAAGELARDLALASEVAPRDAATAESGGGFGATPPSAGEASGKRRITRRGLS